MFKFKMEAAVTIESVCANKHRGKDAQDVITCLSIPNSLLKQWYQEVRYNPADGVSMIKRLNEHLKIIKLKENRADIAERNKSLELQLRMKACNLLSTIKRSSQQKKVKILNSKSIIDIKREQVITVKVMEGTIVSYEETIECYR